MENSLILSAFLSFAAGVLSFASPCVLPVLPGYLVFITGISFEEMTSGQLGARARRSTVFHSLAFILGFSTLFVALGLSITALGSFAARHQALIRQAGGVIIIILGLHVAGWLPWKILYREKKVNIADKPVGLAGSFLVGLTFAAGWTPCVGPILASILIMASTTASLGRGALLLALYALGLGLPFFLAALLFSRFMFFFSRFKRFMRYVGPASGVLLIILGLLLFFDLLIFLIPVPA